MGNLHFTCLEINNFRCFENFSINLNVPNGKQGSGLNLLIGENGIGKTTILEALNYLTLSKFSIENKIKINDFKDFKQPIEVKSSTTETFKCKMPYPGNYFLSSGLQLTIESRSRKSPGKILSSPFQINTSLINTEINYRNSKGNDSNNPVLSFHKIYENQKIEGDEFNIFYFDRYRSRQISNGTFKTTFDKICEDLNWKFIKNLDEENYDKIVKAITEDYFDEVLELSQKGTGRKIAKELSDFFEDSTFKNLKIDLINLLSPFSNSFFAIRNSDQLSQVFVKELGSGIEIILTLLLLRSIAKESKGCITYLIDEPELHLHPKAQESLAKILLEESKDKQIIISTHSPYMFKPLMIDEAGVFTLRRNDNKEITCTKENDKTNKLFPWSPSWGEINYYAYDMPTVDFHNELYGYLQETSKKLRIEDFDKYLNQLGIKKNKKWIKKGKSQSEDVTLQTFIRHSIHHPENQLNLPPYTDSEMRTSIKEMINLLK